MECPDPTAVPSLMTEARTVGRPQVGKQGVRPSEVRRRHHPLNLACDGSWPFRFEPDRRSVDRPGHPLSGGQE